VGAALGPLVMSAALATSPGWRGGYALIAAVLAAMAIAFLVTRRLWDVAAPPARLAVEPAPGLLDTLLRPRVWLNIALSFVYTGLEVSAGQWTYSLLTEGRGVAPAAAGAWTAVYWSGLTAGRIVSGALAGRVAAETLLRAATLGAVASTLLVWRDPGMGLGLVALAALGCCLAPIYPLLIAETPRRVGRPHAASAIGFQVAAAYLGTAAIPGAAGLLATARPRRDRAMSLRDRAAPAFPAGARASSSRGHRPRARHLKARAPATATTSSTWGSVAADPTAPTTLPSTRIGTPPCTTTPH